MEFLKKNQIHGSFVLSLCLFLVVMSCSKNITYTPEHIQATSGRYMFNQEELIEVFYEDQTLFLKWKGADRIKPVALDANTFFVADMYQKLQFVQHPETKKRYLSIIPEDADNAAITFDYLKVADTFKTPSMYLKAKEYDRALAGYQAIQRQDSTSVFINVYEFNSLGYSHLRNKDYEDAIAVFKINAALYPNNDNVYDSLADAYLRSGDSLQAYVNYKKALSLNTGNNRAKKYIDAYNKRSE